MLILVIIFYFILTVIATFPLTFRIMHVIPGFFSTDEPSIWYYWWLEHSRLYKLDSKFSDLIANPAGMDLGMIEKIFPVGILIKKILINLTSPIAAYNLEILSTFLLSGVFTYLLVKHITKNRLAALFSGVIYSFCPYHFVRAWQHTTLAQIQWFPLLLLGLIKLAEHKRIKVSLSVIAAIFFIFSVDLYLGYFSIIIVTTFIIFSALNPGRGRKLRNVFLSAGVGFFLVAILLAPFLRQFYFIQDRTSGAWNITTRPFDDLFSQSARPLSYLLPSTEHPIFGSIAESFIGTDIYGDSFTEHTLYLGWIPLILSLIAYKDWRRRRKQHKFRVKTPKSKSSDDFNIGFFVLLALVAWLFSQPPWWSFFGFKVYMPSFFMYKILPMFRAYCRFGIVLMLAVAVLAGFGLKVVLDKSKVYRIKVAIMILFSLLVLFEFWNYPPFKIIDLSKVPKAYYWLKDQPGDFVVAEYPIYIDAPNEMYKFYQTIHQKKIVNGSIPGSQANKFARLIKDLSSASTVNMLKQIGVKYVVVHHDAYLDTGLVEDSLELERISRNRGLALIKTFPVQECPDNDIICVQKSGVIDVYEVR